MKLPCPVCPVKNNKVVKNGYFTRKSDSKTITRYKCVTCGKRFSSALLSDCYNQNKRRVNVMLKKAFSSNVSMRRCAIIFQVSRVTVARKFKFLSKQARKNQEKYLKTKTFTNIQFDDLETFEHSKCKPITVCMAVEFETRKIIGFSVAPIAAKGLLAKVSVKKYGKRRDYSRRERSKLFKRLTQLISPYAVISSDKHPYYPELIKNYFPHSEHKTYKGVKSCITAQGELKKTFFDPLFSINHTFAMLRANINRLIRKTWCTTKNISALQDHLDLYVDFHNQVLT